MSQGNNMGFTSMLNMSAMSQVQGGGSMQGGPSMQGGTPMQGMPPMHGMAPMQAMPPIQGMPHMQGGPPMQGMPPMQGHQAMQGMGGHAEVEEVAAPSGEASNASGARKTTTRGKQNNFSIEEDKVLVYCWLNVSLDAVAGAGQRKALFWRAIVNNYNAQKPETAPTRTYRSLEGRWSDIKEQCNKFEAHYNDVLLQNRSGYNDHDKVMSCY